jgi:hypothetical protein
MASMSFNWHKFMAGFILLWAMMDMTVPGLCQSDDLEATPFFSQAQTPVTSNNGAVSVTASDRTNNSSSDQSIPEDCFCCCSHVAPTGFFHASVLFTFVGFERPYSLGSLRNFNTFLYRPPKA